MDTIKLNREIDPYTSGYNKTFGETKENIKNKISHRALAFKKLIKFLN